MTQARAVCTFEEPWTEYSVNLDRRLYDQTSNMIELHVRKFASAVIATSLVLLVLLVLLVFPVFPVFPVVKCFPEPGVCSRDGEFGSSARS